MKTAKTAEPTIARDLTPERTTCPHCARPMIADYANRRTIHTLSGVTRLHLTIRRCRNAACAGYKKPYRPEAEGAVALPRHEFGLDVVALVGRLRYAEHRSVPEVRAHLVARKVSVSCCTVLNCRHQISVRPGVGEGVGVRDSQWWRRVDVPTKYLPPNGEAFAVGSPTARPQRERNVVPGVRTWPERVCNGR